MSNHKIQKLIILCFSYLTLIGCKQENISEKDQRLKAVKDTAHKTAEETVHQIITKALNQAVRDIQQKFSTLSQEQLKTTKKLAHKTAIQTAEDTAKQIANKATQQAIDNMKERFSNLSQSQIQVIKSATLEIADQIAQDSAQQAINDMKEEFSKLSQEHLQSAKDSAKKVINDMKEQFSSLSQKQEQTIEKLAHKIAIQTAEDTAKQIANKATQQAIDNMKEQFSDLSQFQIQIIKSATLEIANQIALESAQNIAEKATKKAISNMQKEFSKLSQEHLQNAKETAKQTAKDTAEQASQQAINDMQEQFSSLSQEQKQTIEKLAHERASQIAKDTAQRIAKRTSQQAINDMRDQFSKLSQSQIQVIKSATLEIANQIAQKTAQYVAEKATQQAIDDMQKEFSSLSQEQIQAIKDLALKTAEDTALETANDQAQKVASQIANQRIEDIEKQSSHLLQTQIQTIKSESLKIAESTAREVADSIIEEIVKRTVFPITDRAIKEIETKHTTLLKAGLQSIISAAISSVTAEIPQSTSNSSKTNTVNTAIDSAVTAANAIAFNEESEQDHLIKHSFNLSFEQCDWKNKDYTSKIVKNHTFFPLSDPLQKLMKSWNTFKEEKARQLPATCSDSSSANQIEASTETELNDDKKTKCASTHESSISNEEFAYFSPLYDDFILSFFQDSIKETQLSENDVPLECFFAGAVKGANLYNSGRNFYYCSEDSNRPGNMSVIDDNKNERIIFPQRACLNRDYMFLTAKAFNKTADCFGFDKSEKEMIFKLFNHESSFLHNIKSPTGAKCYGQLTGNAIKEINKQIYFSNSKSPLSYSYIFDDLIEECPGLQNAILNPKIYEPQSTPKTMKKLNSIVSKLPISCKITQNPYTCLFYAFYNFKINSSNIEQELQRPTTSFGANNNIPLDFKDKFLLPILLNEMRGVTNVSGKDMIFWDDFELWSSLKRRSPDSLQNIRPLPLFENEKEVKNLFNVWAYNGGISISNYMRDFIRQLKRSIARSCSPNATSKTCQYRFAIQKGQGIATEDIKKDFQTYILQHYEPQKSKSRRIEVKTFTENVEKSLDYLYNKNGLFRIHLKNLVPELENHDIENFQDYLKDICPTADPSLFN